MKNLIRIIIEDLKLNGLTISLDANQYIYLYAIQKNMLDEYLLINMDDIQFIQDKINSIIF